MDAHARQRCKVCGRPDKFNFSVPDDVWLLAVPEPFAGAVVCLFCFDAFAEARGVDYAPGLGELWFCGDKAVFEFAAKQRVAL